MVATWLVCSYALAYFATVASTYIVAILTIDVDVFPLLCEAGSEAPAYNIFAGGMTVSSVLYMGVVWSLYSQMGSLSSTMLTRSINMTALLSGFAAAVGLAVMATLSIRGRFRRKHNDAAHVYLLTSLIHAILVTVMSWFIPESMWVRLWRVTVCLAALICVVGMWKARKEYIRIIRQQQPMYKNLFDGQPVAREISDGADIMGDLDFGQGADGAQASEMGQIRRKRAPTKEGKQLLIKRLWAACQILGIGCLLLFQISLAF